MNEASVAGRRCRTSYREVGSMKLFHKHKYVCLQARQYRDISYVGEPGVEATQCAYRCACGKLKSNILIGLWTIEMINGPAT